MIVRLGRRLGIILHRARELALQVNLNCKESSCEKALSRMAYRHADIIAPQPH